MQFLVFVTLVGAACASAIPWDLPESARHTEGMVRARAADIGAETGEATDGHFAPAAVPVPVQDTPEVAAAKTKFQAAFDAAAKAAEDAPDFDEDGKISAYTGYLSTIDGRLSPYYTNTFPFGAYGVHAPFVAAPHVTPYAVHAPVVVPHRSPVTPLVYNHAGYPGAYGYTHPGFYGFPNVHGFQGHYPYPFIHVVQETPAEEEPAEEEHAVEEA